MSYHDRNKHSDDPLTESMEGGMVTVSSSHNSEEAVRCGIGLAEAEVFGSGGEELVRDAYGVLFIVSELCHQRPRRDVGPFEHVPYGGKDDDEYDPCDDDEDDDEEEDEDEDDLFSDDPDADFDEEEEDEDEDLDDDFEDVIRLSA